TRLYLVVLIRLVRLDALHHLDAFFFSSRRRHTRLVSDWSSDVCSSDLSPVGREFKDIIGIAPGYGAGVGSVLHAGQHANLLQCEIGRASCRERVEISVGAVSLTKNR